MITYIWAEDQKHEIGLAGHLPWHLPNDLKHFKELTLGHPIVMGRKTFISLPTILPQRQHIVLSSSKDLKSKYAAHQQVLILPTLAKLDTWLADHSADQIFVIGGAMVFEALQERVDCLEKTEIKASFAGDTVMPPLDYSQFKLIKKIAHQPDEQNKYPYVFKTYLRKNDLADK
ncbi:dihydrofolate reductase [Lactobacillus xylocopicola]|uniref:Dihydrofolate reductase n=1 Tax=Lactobacillus xylocopicola TaxID=2976676 RepID=A0ABM8BH39_9LACO|nr:dihydrofolate reductase [Lactobacillus xylocopicola]BDR60593.1 dihydrofolate reductase [Lactobacillus xylocopicola]